MRKQEPDIGRLCGEEITPQPGSFDTSMMARGIPGVPRRFVSKGKDYEVAQVMKTWKSLGPCESGADEKYVRGHFYRVLTTSGEVMVLYCSRHWERGREKIKGRWMLYAVEPSGSAEG